MRKQIKNAKPKSLLKALCTGTDLRGYIETSQTNTLDNYTRGES